jgi:hypothetical protein
MKRKYLSDIANAAEQQHCKIIIIDNLSYLCNAAEKGSDAGSFMVKLDESEKGRRNWSDPRDSPLLPSGIPPDQSPRMT